MQTTTITCDHCRQFATTQDEKTKQDIKKVAVGVWAERYGSGSEFSSPDAIHHAEWCAECRTKAGLFYLRKDAPTPEPARLTLEDLIREIAEDAARNAQSQ